MADHSASADSSPNAAATLALLARACTGKRSSELDFACREVRAAQRKLDQVATALERGERPSMPDLVEATAALMRVSQSVGQLNAWADVATATAGVADRA